MHTKRRLAQRHETPMRRYRRQPVRKRPVEARALARLRHDRVLKAFHEQLMAAGEVERVPSSRSPANRS